VGTRRHSVERKSATSHCSWHSVVTDEQQTGHTSYIGREFHALRRNWFFQLHFHLSHNLLYITLTPTFQNLINSFFVQQTCCSNFVKILLLTYWVILFKIQKK